MNKLICLSLMTSLLLFQAPAHAEAPDNDAQGAAVAAPGFTCPDGTCYSNTSGAPIVAKRSYDSLLPESTSKADDKSSGATK